MMTTQSLLTESEKNKDFLKEIRHYLHSHPGTGFEISDTMTYVKQQLTSMGYEPKQCGRAGLTAVVGGKKPGKVFLLRADMDALPIKEESGVTFASTNGCMHACGHDMHTSMLLGAAKLLKNHEDEINGTTKLMFQPAEEIFEGSKDMIDSGVLKNPDVDVALMIHVMAGVPLPEGSVTVSDGGVSAPAADYFKITVQGKGCHGSMPNTGVDPINAAAHIITGLQEIHARELALNENAVLTFGTIHGGQADNVIPDQVTIGGTLRTYDEEVRAYIKKRMDEISQGIAASFRAEATLSFGSGCPVLQNDNDLSACTVKYLRELLGPQKAFTNKELTSMSGNSKTSKSAGSEDFAYISQEVPSIMVALAAGTPERGYLYPQHHPGVLFDEEVLVPGSAVYAYAAMRWLEEH